MEDEEDVSEMILICIGIPSVQLVAAPLLPSLNLARAWLAETLDMVKENANLNDGQVLEFD
jgi:hypothetical protein